MKTIGYYRRRRGILDHIRDGRLSPLDSFFHDLLCQLADTGTGVARTSAADIHREFRIGRKLAQKYLCRLERKGYIRRFRKARSKALQTTLIHRYECTSLPHKGKFLNAWESGDYATNPQVFYSTGIQSGIHSGIHSASGPNREFELKNINKKETTAQNPRGLLPDQAEHQRRTQAKQRRQHLEALGVPRTQKDRARGKENAIEVRRRSETDAIDDAIAHERTAAKPPQKPPEVSTAGAIDPRNTQTATDTPITRARDMQTREEEANRQVSRAAAAAAGVYMSIARARESTNSDTNGTGSIQSKPGPQAIEQMSPEDIAAEMKRLKMKLSALGNGT